MQPLHGILHHAQAPRQQRQHQDNESPMMLPIIRGRDQNQQPSRQAENRTVITVDPLVLRAFIRTVYLVTFLFILITSVTWLAVTATHTDFNREVPVPYYVWILLAFFLFMIMGCFPGIRYQFPFNWVLSILIVILITLAGLGILNLVSPLLIALGLLISMIIIAIFYVSGAMCPQQMLPGIVITASLTCFLALSLLILCIVGLFIRSPIMGLIFAVTLMCLLAVVMPFHAQYIHGRLEIPPILDLMHCALVVYTHYILVLFVIGYFYIYYRYKQS